LVQLAFGIFREAAGRAGNGRGFTGNFPFENDFRPALWRCAYLPNSAPSKAFSDMDGKVPGAYSCVVQMVSTLPSFRAAKVLTTRAAMLQCERKAISQAYFVKK